MSRTQRIDYPGAIHHITQRGNNHSFIFSKPREKFRLKQLIHEALSKFDSTLLAYVIMGNHYHLVMKSGETPIYQVMMFINGQYARYYNYLHDHSGHVFETRYRSYLITSHWHFLRTLKYLAYNPVRAGLSQHPREYQWSSHREVCGEEVPLVDIAQLFKLVGSEKATKQSNYSDPDSNGISSLRETIIAYDTYIDCVENPNWVDDAKIPVCVDRHLTYKEKLNFLVTHLDRQGIHIKQDPAHHDLFTLLARRDGISDVKIRTFLRPYRTIKK